MTPGSAPVKKCAAICVYIVNKNIDRWPNGSRDVSRIIAALTIILNLSLIFTDNALAAAEAVVWTDTVGVSISGNSLTKTAANGWGNAGAASTQTIVGDGYVEFTASMTNKARFIGLSTTNTDASYTSIHYGLNASSAGSLIIYESGTAIGTFGTYATNDILRVERVGTTIYYKKNGTTFYTSTAPSTGMLIADIALNHNGVTLNNAMINGVDATAPTWAVTAGAISATSTSSTSITVNLGNGSRSDNVAVDRVRIYFVQSASCGSNNVDRATASYQDFTTNPDTATLSEVTNLTLGLPYCFEATIRDAVGNEEATNTTNEVAGTTIYVASWLDDTAPSDTTNNVFSANGGIVQTTTAKIGAAAARLPGNSGDYLSANDNAELDPAEILICLWGRRDNIATTSEQFMQKNYGYQIGGATNGQIWGKFWEPGSTTSGSIFNGTNVMTSNNWHHICASYANNQVRSWINNGTAGSAAFSGTLQDNTNPMWLSRKGFELAGYADAVKIWDVSTLTDTQINTLVANDYNSGSGNDCANTPQPALMTACWDFETPVNSGPLNGSIMIVD
jgi:hypothetical protein